MDHIQASWVFYVKVGMFDRLEQSKMSILTVTTLGIVMLILQYDLIFSICLLSNPWDLLRQKSADILSMG